MRVIVKNGHIYEGDQVVKPEIGNIAHINALKESIKLAELKDEAEEVEIFIDCEPVAWDVSFKWDCLVCGKENSFSDEIDNDFWHLEGQTFKCRECGTTHIITDADSNSIILNVEK